MASAPKVSVAKRRILYLSTDLVPERGGNAVAAWILQALTPVYDVTVLTWTPPDFAALDRRFGTSLATSSFTVRTPGAMPRWLVERIPDASRLQRVSYLLRSVKRHCGGFAAVIACCSTEVDFGRPGIQYIHYPYLGARREQLSIAGDAPMLQKIRGLLTGRLRPWMILSGYSFERMRANLTLTNSRWTRDEIRRVLAIDSEVVYPPVVSQGRPIPWEEREDGFVAVGTLEDAKRQDWIIETLAQVRRHAPGIRLHICGSKSSSCDSSRISGGYAERVEALAKAHGPWIEFHYDLSHADLARLVGRQRYGIHGTLDEHFGMAPAEMAASGCIPFVHASGGQVEIVDCDPRLCYTGQEDAVVRILAVLHNRALQEELRTAVQQRSTRFSTEVFMRAMEAQVDQFIAGRDREP